VLSGEISVDRLVRMTPEQLASPELATWREQETKHVGIHRFTTKAKLPLFPSSIQQKKQLIAGYQIHKNKLWRCPILGGVLLQTIVGKCLWRDLHRLEYS